MSQALQHLPEAERDGRAAAPLLAGATASCWESRTHTSGLRLRPSAAPPRRPLAPRAPQPPPLRWPPTAANRRPPTAAAPGPRPAEGPPPGRGAEPGRLREGPARAPAGGSSPRDGLERLARAGERGCAL